MSPQPENDTPELDSPHILAALDRHQVNYVLVGGLAAYLYGAQRPTIDIDVCPAWDRANLTRLAEALNSLGAELRGPEGGVLHGLTPDVGFLHGMEMTGWRTRHGDIDVLLGIPETS